MTDKARLAAALKHALLMHKHDDIVRMAEAIADDLLTNLGVRMPDAPRKDMGRRAPAEKRTPAN